MHRTLQSETTTRQTVCIKNEFQIFPVETYPEICSADLIEYNIFLRIIKMNSKYEQFSLLKIHITTDIDG